MTCELPGDLAPGDYTVTLTLRQGADVLSRNSYDSAVVPIPTASPATI